ncbi:MAG: S8 family peptidase, partial [Vicinamibacterales bacterium]
MRRVLFGLIAIAAWLAVAVPAPVVTAPRQARLSADLHLHRQTRARHKARVIVHGDRATVRGIAARHGLRVVRELQHEAVLEATGAQLGALAAETGIDHLSGDVRVYSAMGVSNRSTAADQTRAGTTGLLLGLGAIAGVNGEGVGIALLDSGISPHKALGARVVASVSMVTGDRDPGDDFGHGTHIAGIISGSASAAGGVTTSYEGGIAPGAHLVNVRVLGDNGTGLTSDVIAGIDWVIANKDRFKIRIMNLSLGHSVMEPVATDPLCEAVERAVRAGIVVTASAGNRGKAEDGSPILGGITSPGNSPYAITVGALNTWNTVSRSDDSVTTYSSRGPTRYDLGVKPDVVAPGNKVVSLQAVGSYLGAAYPATHVAGRGINAYMRLSGSSMATGVVTGGVALLLQGKRDLTPAQVKLLLQTGSSYLPEDGLMAGGAGSVNLWSSRRASANGLDDLLTYLPLIGGLLTPPGGAAFWDEGTMTGRLYAGTGIRLLGLWDLVSALLNPSKLTWGTLHLVGRNNPIGSMEPNYVIWGDVSRWSDSSYVIWGDTIQSPEGNYVIWGDTQMTEGYYV